MVMPLPVTLPPSQPDAWRVPVGSIAKPITLFEAETLVDHLERFASAGAQHYGAAPAECSDAIAVIADLRAWLADLAGRNSVRPVPGASSQRVQL